MTPEEIRIKFKQACEEADTDAVAQSEGTSLARLAPSIETLSTMVHNFREAGIDVGLTLHPWNSEEQFKIVHTSKSRISLGGELSICGSSFSLAFISKEAGMECNKIVISEVVSDMHHIQRNGRIVCDMDDPESGIRPLEDWILFIAARSEYLKKHDVMKAFDAPFESQLRDATKPNTVSLFASPSRRKPGTAS